MAWNKQVTSACNTVPALWEDESLPTETWFKSHHSQESWPSKAPAPTLSKLEGSLGLGHWEARCRGLSDAVPCPPLPVAEGELVQWGHVGATETPQPTAAPWQGQPGAKPRRDGACSCACTCVSVCLHMSGPLCLWVCTLMLTDTKGSHRLTSWMMLETLSQLAGLMFSPPSTRPS